MPNPFFTAVFQAFQKKKPTEQPPEPRPAAQTQEPPKPPKKDQ